MKLFSANFQDLLFDLLPGTLLCFQCFSGPLLCEALAMTTSGAVRYTTSYVKRTTDDFRPLKFCGEEINHIKVTY